MRTMSFEQYFKSSWNYILIFQYFGVWISVISEFSFLGIGLKTKTRKSRKIFILGLKSSNTLDLFFDHYFNFLSAKTEINKTELNLINLDGLEALKRQICGTWVGIWQNHFEIYVIWRTSQMLFEAALSYFSIVTVL